MEMKSRIRPSSQEVRYENAAIALKKNPPVQQIGEQLAELQSRIYEARREVLTKQRALNELTEAKSRLHKLDREYADFVRIPNEMECDDDSDEDEF